MRKRLSMTEELSHEGMDDLKRLTFDIMKMTAAVELSGALLLSLAFSRYYEPGRRSGTVFSTALWRSATQDST